MSKVPVAGGASFLQKFKEFDDEHASVDEGVSEGSSSLGVNLLQDLGDGGVFCVFEA